MLVSVAANCQFTDSGGRRPLGTGRRDSKRHACQGVLLVPLPPDALMRILRRLLPVAVFGATACGPTYIVQRPPSPAPQAAPELPPPPRVPPLEVSVVRPEEGRVLIQTSRPAYVALFEIVPGRGVSVVYPQPMRQRDQMLTGLNWIPVYWTMKPRFVSNDTRYVYAVASDTPLLLSDEDYDARHLERELGSTYYSSNPNATVRAIARQFVRSQPDEWWGEDMYTVPLRDGRMDLIVRLARVYCPGGVYFDVREDMADHIWCPARRMRSGDRPVASEPDSVFNSGGRRVPRHVDPSQRTPIFRVPAATDVGQQQGHPTSQPERPHGYPRTQPQPQNPTIPTQNQPQPPPQQQPPQQQPPQAQAPQNQPPQGQPGQPTPNDSDAAGKGNNGRRAHGDPRNADPRGNGNGYGNGGRGTQTPPQTPPTTTPAASTPQPQQQGQGQQGQGQQGQGQQGQ